MHSIWAKAATLKCHMIVDRVPSKYNISDQPSRGHYGLLHALDAEFVEPQLDKMFWEETAWNTVVLMREL